MARTTDLGRRFLLNAAAYGYGPVVTLIVQLVQVPLFLAFWGVEKYGQWLVLTGIPLMLVVADAGVAQASASKCIMEIGRRNFEQARNTLRTARAYSILVALFLAAAGVVLSICVDWAALLKLSSISSGSAGVVIVFAVCYVAVTLQGGYLGAWLRASDHTPVHAFIEGSTRVFDLAAVALTLSVGGGAVAVAAALLISALLCRLAHGAVARRLSSEQLRLRGKASLGQLRAVIKPSAAFIGITLTQTLTVQGGIQMLNQISTQQTVVLFNTVRILARTLVLFGGAVSSALRPELSRLVGKGLTILAAAFARRVTVAVVAAGIILYLLLVAFGPLVVQEWTNSKVEASHFVIGIIGIHALLHVAWLIPATLRIATNRHAPYAAVYGASAVLAYSCWIAYVEVIPPVLGAAAILAIPEAAMVSLIIIKIAGINTGQQQRNTLRLH
jgi:O-antigen/teichoic acid export membrane protein